MYRKHSRFISILLLFVVAALSSSLVGCDVAGNPAQVAATPTSLPLVSAATTAVDGSAANLTRNRQLLTIETSKGTMLVEVYPDAAPHLVAAFAQHYKQAVGRQLVSASAVTWFMSDEHYTPAASVLVAVERNNLAYKRGSLVLPFDQQGQVNAGSFAILNYDVATGSKDYLNYQNPPYAEYPGYVVVGQVVSGFNLLSELNFGGQVTGVELSETAAAVATLAAVPATPTMVSGFQVTHLFTITLNGGRVLGGELYGNEAPEGVGLFVQNYQRYKGAMINNQDLSLSISDGGGSELRAAGQSKLPVRRGSLLWNRGETADLSGINLAKYEDVGLNKGVIGQVTSGLEWLDKLGQDSAPLLGHDDKVEDVVVQELAAIPTVTPAAVDGPGAGSVVLLIFTRQAYINIRLYAAPTLKIEGQDDSFIIGTKFKTTSGRVELPADPHQELRVPVEIRKNSLPYKRGSVLMRPNPDVHSTDKIIILTQDQAAEEPGYYVVGAVSTDTLGLVDKLTSTDKAAYVQYLIVP